MSGANGEPEGPASWWKAPWLRLALKLALTAGILAVLFRLFDLGGVLRTLRHAHPGWCAAGFAGMLAISFLGALQLRLALTSQQIGFSLAYVWRIQLVSMFYGVIVPSEFAGGAVKWYRLSNGGKHTAQAAAVVVYVRLVNTVTLLALGFLAVFWEGRIASDSLRVAAGVLLLASVLCLLPFYSAAAGAIFTRLAHRTTRLPGVPHVLASKTEKACAAVTAFSGLGAGRQLAILLLGLIAHFVGIGVFFCLSSAVEIHISLWTLAWLRLVLYLVQIIPISVVGLGVREATLVSILPALYDVSPESCLALSFLFLARRLVLAGIGGLLEAHAFLLKGEAV